MFASFPSDIFATAPSPVPPGTIRFNPDYSPFDVMTDPAATIRGMPPNMGEMMLPHAVTYQGTLSSISRVYRPSDEAIKHSYQNARFMRNDPTLMECVELRQQATCLFDWHVEPEDEKDPEQVDAAAQLTKMLEAIPRFMQYRENLLHATWYGKYGVQQKWGWKRIGRKMRMTITDWRPVNGDKIVFRYDDGMAVYRPDQIGIRIGMGYPGGYAGLDKKWGAMLEKSGFRGAVHKIDPTDNGLAYFLDTWERPLLALHKYQIEDGEYEEPTNAGRIHGKGLRSVLYWVWHQKQEALALLMDYLERAAFGFNVWYYPMNNAEAKEAVERAALKQNEGGGARNILFFPLPPTEDAGLYQVQHVEPGMGGAAELKEIITNYFGHQFKRYILGQVLTTEAASTGLGSGVADIHVATFMQKIRYDSQLVEESITTDTLEPLVRFNFPRLASKRFRFRIDTEVPDAEAKLKALVEAYGMGLRIPAQHVRDLLGVPTPDADAEVLDQTAQQQQAFAGQMQQGMQFGRQSQASQEGLHGVQTSPIALDDPVQAAAAPHSEDSDRDRMIQSDDERPAAPTGELRREIIEALRREFGARSRRAA